jgi:glycosyltransferase involved in cell wall biosynthesis
MIVPSFNEEKRIKLNYWNDLARIPNVHWIFVNDGSSDDTKEVLNKITNSTIIDINKNVGKAEAIRKGITETYKKNS